MKRTQIFIDDDIFSFLKKESKTAHRSVCEIIRESIKEKYQHQTNLLLKRLDTIYGIWGKRNINAVNYIKNIRKDRTL